MYDSITGSFKFAPRPEGEKDENNMMVKTFFWYNFTVTTGNLRSAEK